MVRSNVHGGLVAMLVGMACWNAKADDNVLGLPAPRDPRHPGAVVLHGGGRMTNDVFERFVQLAGDRDARIVLVPCAGYRWSDYDSEDDFLDAMKLRFSAWVSLASNGRIRSFQFLYTDNDRDADRVSFVKPLETATGVWFCGGWQPRLNYRFVGQYPEKTRFQTALHEVVERGGVVGGTSAGMAAMPEIMTMWQDRDYADAPCSAVPAHGLGLLRGAIVEQHFDARGGRLERFTGLLRNSPLLDSLSQHDGSGAQMVGLAVEERGALVVQGDRLEVLGSANAHVFLKAASGRTINWHELSPGESAQVRRDVPGSTVVRREEVLLTR